MNELDDEPRLVLIDDELHVPLEERVFRSRRERVRALTRIAFRDARYRARGIVPL